MKKTYALFCFYFLILAGCEKSSTDLEKNENQSIEQVKKIELINQELSGKLEISEKVDQKNAIQFGSIEEMKQFILQLEKNYDKAVRLNAPFESSFQKELLNGETARFNPCDELNGTYKAQWKNWNDTGFATLNFTI